MDIKNNLKVFMNTLIVGALLLASCAKTPDLDSMTNQQKESMEDVIKIEPQDDKESFGIKAVSYSPLTLSLASESPLDYKVFKTNESFTKTWNLKAKNSGFLKEIAFISNSGSRLSNVSKIPVNKAFKAGETFTISLPMKAASNAGEQKEKFSAIDDKGKTILVSGSSQFWVVIKTQSVSKVIPAPIMSQRDSSYSGLRLGSCSGTTIGGYGCAITSLAMGLKSKGLDTNPAKVNTELIKIKGYSGGCNLSWSSIPKLSNYKVSTAEITGSNVEKELQNGNPVIARVRGYFSSFPTHFVLIVGKAASGKWIINEPYYGKQEELTRGYIDAYHVLR